MSKTKPKQPPEPTDAQKLKRANDAVRMNQAWAAIWKVADEPIFRAYFLPKGLKGKADK
jgi:hypothetical protein